jgi:hypothetical protein
MNFEVNLWNRDPEEICVHIFRWMRLDTKKSLPQIIEFARRCPEDVRTEVSNMVRGLLNMLVQDQETLNVGYIYDDGEDRAPDGTIPTYSVSLTREMRLGELLDRQKLGLARVQ